MKRVLGTLLSGLGALSIVVVNNQSSQGHVSRFLNPLAGKRR